VRARSALAATLVVALVLAVAAVAQVFLLQRSLVVGIDSAVATRAQQVAGAIPPTGVGRGSDDDVEALTEAVTAASLQASVVQVLAPNGTVVAASDDIDGEEPLSPVRPGPGDLVREDRRVPVGDEDEFRLVITAVRTDAGLYTVIVGQSMGAARDSIQAVAVLVVLGYPILLVVVGSATFWFVGRSLRPVEAIRAKVARIGGRELTERVPVPPAEDEVARLAVTMNQMLDRLEAAARSQRRFVADASHELRSPIATLKATAEIALAHPDQSDADRAAVAAGTLAETRRLERLVNDLLLLARADESGLRLDRREVDLDDLLTAETTRIRATTGLQVTVHINAVRVLGDPHQLAQAMRNLIDNATRHARTQVGLILTRDATHAVLEVSDDGPGIPPADRKRVFDRFVRLDESRQRARGGSGLGLAIVREIVTAHGGTVAVADSPTGARLRLVLPLEL